MNAGPFRSSPFRWLCGAGVATSVGGGIERTATAWLALETGDAFSVGVVLAARMLPNLLFGLAAGTLADRIDRRRQLATVLLATFPVAAGMAWLTNHQATLLCARHGHFLLRFPEGIPVPADNQPIDEL